MFKNYFIVLLIENDMVIIRVVNLRAGPDSPPETSGRNGPARPSPPSLRFTTLVIIYDERTVTHQTAQFAGVC